MFVRKILFLSVLLVLTGCNGEALDLSMGSKYDDTELDKETVNNEIIVKGSDGYFFVSNGTCAMLSSLAHGYTPEEFDEACTNEDAKQIDLSVMTDLVEQSNITPPIQDAVSDELISTIDTPPEVVIDTPVETEMTIDESITDIFDQIDALDCILGGTEEQIQLKEIYMEECEEEGYTTFECRTVMPQDYNYCSTDEINQQPTQGENIPEQIIPETPTEIKTEFAIASTEINIRSASSYLANGRCFINNLSPTLADYTLEAGQHGFKTVREIDAILKGQTSYRPYKSSYPSYNDIQCGNILTTIDVGADCAGRIDMGNIGCSVIGPKWKFDTDHLTTINFMKDLEISSTKVTTNNIEKYGEWWNTLLIDGRSIWVDGASDNVAYVIEYINVVYPETDTKNINVIDVVTTDTLKGPVVTMISQLASFIGVDTERQVIDVIINNRK